MTTTSDKLPMVTPADWIPGPKQGHWAYPNYIALPDDGHHYEIVNGVLFMTPSPSGAHQDAVGEFFSYLRTHVKLTGLGVVRMAPFDVVLGPNNVFQPDILVVLNANRDKIMENYILGAPDLVVEVASPGTATYDRHKKFNAYARARVPEYWIADPEAHTVEVWVLEADEYRSLGLFRGKATLASYVLPEFAVRVEQFFI